MATVGRPRRKQKAQPGPTRKDILLAANRLFQTKGYAATSIREIAEEAGLRKSSLYYYFSRKEDILADMLQSVLVPPLKFMRRIDREPGSPAVRLFRLIHFDIQQLCTAPYDYSALLTMPETRRARYADFWQERKQMLTWIEGNIKQGISGGEFADTDISVAARAVFALDEFTVSWYDPDECSPHEIAEKVASYALRGLLKRPAQVKRILLEAQAAKA